jgi:hypothetical protein
MGTKNSTHSKQRAAAAQRRPKAIEMHVEGETFEKIGEALGVSTKTAYNDVEAAKALLDEQSVEIARAARQKELDSLDWQEEEAQRAYQRSLRPGQRTVKVGKIPKQGKKDKESGVKPQPVVSQVTITDEQRDGDSKWLAEIRAIQKRRAELLKYDPGSKLNIGGHDGKEFKARVTHDVNTDALNTLLDRAESIRAFNLLLSGPPTGTGES